MTQEGGIEGLPQLETEANQRVRNMIECLRLEKGGSYQQVKVIYAGTTQANLVLKELLIEDCKNPKKEFGYLTFLTHLHRLIMDRAQKI